jgi:excisionase family DNA binding protein
MDDKFLTIDEVCERLQIGRTTLWRWRKEGMPYIKYGNSVRFDWKEVSSWFKENNKK